MIIAHDKSGKKIRAEKGKKGYCPLCGSELTAKCGRIVVHHWAHDFGECDSWAGPETEWHRYWKSLVPPECVEVVIERDGVKHRADIMTRNGMVVELQHSSISPDEIEKRELFYGRMLWLFDISDAKGKAHYAPAESLRMSDSMKDRYPKDSAGNPLVYVGTSGRFFLRKKDGFNTFLWQHPRKSLMYAKSEVYLDVGDNEIFRIKKIHDGPSWTGWGHLNTKEKFESWLKKACAA